MQIKGAEASGQAWRDGSPKCMAAMEPRAINDRSGSNPDSLLGGLQFVGQAAQFCFDDICHRNWM
jgi:hypothetical protein